LHGSKINHLKENSVSKVHGNINLIFKNWSNTRILALYIWPFPDKTTLFKTVIFYTFFDINITKTGISK
jgi:hypothetical protein